MKFGNLTENALTDGSCLPFFYFLKRSGACFTLTLCHPTMFQNRSKQNISNENKGSLCPVFSSKIWWGCHSYYNTSIIGETLGMQVYNNINNSGLSCNEPILTISIIPNWLNCSLQTNKQSQCQRCLQFQLQMEC